MAEYALIVLMPQKKTRNKKVKNAVQEVDSIFFFKMLLYLILGSMWLKISDHNSLNVPIPVGLLIGLLFASHEHFQIDKKIEFALLLVAMLVGFFAPYGLYISLI